ncbi:MAG TPA: TerB family tellurite resistance protein [Ignavibacteria bacterium]|nr:TerB family tellurite resistance protein [Ignavibacteria bacterium]
MLQFFRELLSTDSNQNNNKQHYSSDSVSENTERKLQLATCALFLEVAHADDIFDPSEEKVLISLMKKMFDLKEDEVNELIKQSDEIIRESVSLYEFTDVINAHFDKEEKYEIIKNLWRLILADEKINKYEEHFVRTISNNFHLEHKDLIAAKLEIKEELGI